MNYKVDIRGYYGLYGGAYIPEMLYANIQALTKHYEEIRKDNKFKDELRHLLRDYSGRPTPLYYAGNLSEKIGVKVYLKREDLNHTGAHKINNAIGQVLLAIRMKKRRIIAETGAGQHGVATATACALKGLRCTVYMGATDMERQSPNVERMRLLGAEVVAVHSGNKTLKDATNEAIRDWINHPGETHYVIGSVVGPHPYPDMVRYFQSVIGEEMKTQFTAITGRSYPGAIVACIGGGSNAAGAFDAFLEQREVSLYAVEAAGKGVDTAYTAATLAKGSVGIIHGSKTYLMQNADGQITEPYSISAGLDYPGTGPLHAHLFHTGRAAYLNVTDEEALQAGIELAKLEGIIPALESAHALAALYKIPFRRNEEVILCLSGRGDKDLDSYLKHLQS